MGEMRSLAGNYVVFHHSSTVVPTDLSTFACLPVLVMRPVHLLVGHFATASTAFLSKFHRRTRGLSRVEKSAPKHRADGAKLRKLGLPSGHAGTNMFSNEGVHASGEAI